MTEFRITAPDGRTLKITGDTPPTESELNEIFEATGTTQSIMDVRDGQIYNAPITMDGIDTQYAIDTQHKGANSANYFGKVRMAFDAVADTIEEEVNDINRGVVEHIGGLADTVIEKTHNYQDVYARVQHMRSGDYSERDDSYAGRANAEVPIMGLPAKGYYKIKHWWKNRQELSEEEKTIILAREEERLQSINALRQKVADKFAKAAKILRPNEQMDDIDKFMVQVGGAMASVTETAAAVAITKNPNIAAGAISGMYAAMKDTEYFDKAVNNGMDADDAIRNAKIAGAIEGGIELVGDKVLFGVSRIKPIRELGNKVLAMTAEKVAATEVGKSALKKIATRHTDSVLAAFAKGYLTEGGEELSQEALGQIWENVSGAADNSAGDIIRDSLMSFAIGGIPGGGMATIGVSIHNRNVRDTNERLKKYIKAEDEALRRENEKMQAVIQQQTPELTEEETQVLADGLQEVLYQESPQYQRELMNLYGKELSDDMPGGIDTTSMTAEIRAKLKEKYSMTDEQINRTLDLALNYIDIREKYNTTYTDTRDAMIMAEVPEAQADAGARIYAAFAVEVARKTGLKVEDVNKILMPQFIRQTFADFAAGKPAANKFAQSREYIANVLNTVPESYSAADKTKLGKLLAKRARYGNLKPEKFNTENSAQWFAGRTPAEAIAANEKIIKAIEDIRAGKITKAATNKKINPNDIDPFEALVNPKLLRGLKRQDKGDSLLRFLKKKGGLKDVGGELKAMDAGKQYIGLINNKSGNNFDDMALSAWKNGYFPEKNERPDVNDLLEAIRDELAGNKRYQYQEGVGGTIVDYVDELATQFNMLGIDYAGMTAEEARRAYDEASDRYNEEYAKNMAPFIELELDENGRITQEELERQITDEGDFAFFQPAENAIDNFDENAPDNVIVRNKKGNIAHGYISAELAQKLGSEEGNIVVYNYLLNHLSDTRKKAIQGLGYEDIRDFIDDVFTNWDSIYEGKGGSFAVVKNVDKSNTVYIKLEQSGNLYKVNTIIPSRKDYFKNKKKLAERAQTNQSLIRSPSAFSGANSNDNITPSVQKVKKNKPFYQSAFAGSRVDYDEPSIEAIGSGEGNQVHGWGLYYALNRDVAESYRKAFLGSQSFSLRIQNKSLGDVLYGIDGFLGYYDGALLLLDKNPDMNPKEYFVKALNEYISDFRKNYQRTNIDSFKRNYEKAESVKANIEKLPDSDFTIKQWGQVHEVDLPENPYLLDEQKPFSEQSEIVKKELEDIFNNLPSRYLQKYPKMGITRLKEFDFLGGEIYATLKEAYGSDKAASELLGEHGIKGITYEGRQDGRCFVIFNPKDVKVMQKFYQETVGKAQQNNTVPRGAYRKGIIYLFENADASTIVHEMAHFFLDNLQKFAGNEAIDKQLAAIYEYLGAKDGQITDTQHEYFANSFELYLVEGKAPNQVLGGVFARFKQWLKVMWWEMKRLAGVKINDNIRKVFDDMLGGRSLDFAMQVSSLKMAQNAESGNISNETANLAVSLLEQGKVSRADLDNILDRLKTGELARRDVHKELKAFENSEVKHHEALNPFDKVKYREAFLRGNVRTKDVLEKLNRLLKWTEPRTVNGRDVGRFNDKQTNDFFDAVRADLALDKAAAKEQITINKGIITSILQSESLPEMERKTVLGMRIKDSNRADLLNKLALENRILSIPAKTITLQTATKLYSDISDSYNIGRLTANVTGELKKARINKMIQETKDVLTNNGQIDWHQEKSEAKKFINRMGQSQLSWGGLMNLLSMNDKNSQSGQSKLSQMADVFNEEQAEAKGIAEDGERLSTYLAEAFNGVGNNDITVMKYINSELSKKVKIEWNAGAKTFTKDQLIDIYMKAQDPETRKIMLDDELNAYNESFLSAVENELTARDKAFANALFKFYNDNYEKINTAYEDKYGVSMPHNPHYSPRTMLRTGINIEDGSMAFAAAGFTKKRTSKGGAVEIKGAFATWNKYVTQTNHWLAWSDKLIDINAIFGDTEIKKIIENQFGAITNKRLKTEITNMAGSKVPDGWGKIFDKVRSNFAKSVLAVKPSLGIKQLTSFPAYLEHMSVKDFSAGIADFFTHPKEAIEILGNTTLMKTRGTDIIRDFAELSKLDVLKGKRGFKLSDMIMLNIKYGDRGAIYLGGWALYKSELKKNLAAGMSEAKAKKKALEKFERVTDETQQSGRISQQSYWQSNAGLRAFTMFMSSQNQYLRKEITAVRDMATGRMSVKQGLKTLFIFHVLLPCLFQYAADGFDWDKKAQLKAAVLGSLNGFFIVANILSNIWDAAAGVARSRHLMVKDVLQGYGSVEDLFNFFINLADEDYEFEDLMAVFKQFGKPVAELSGVPVKYPMDLINHAGEYADVGEYKKEVLLWLGWSPYALRDKDDD